MKKFDEAEMKNIRKSIKKRDRPEAIIPLQGTKNKGIDPDTGEGYRYESEIDIERKKKFARMNSNRKQNKFTNTNMDKIDYICEQLTNAQIGYLMILQCFIDYKGKLVKSQKDKTPIKTADFLRILGLEDKRRTFYDFKDKCLAKGILIYTAEEKTYSINKEYIFKGAFGGMNVVSMVTKGIKEGLEGNKPEELAMIFKLQQFVNFKTMALVKNPDETDSNKLDFMKQKDLAEALDVTTSYLSRKLYQIKIKGEYIVAKIKVGTEPTKFMLNPNIFFRGDYVQTQETIAVDVAPFFKVRKKN
ncbi:hypothetical protein ABFV99_02300 [Cytobacillus horneckiae]|uniref:hypothetical protein n=1 Tax=Cytobacillus horneckiae TaxID=549687 RepID=UPI0034CF0B24